MYLRGMNRSTVRGPDGDRLTPAAWTRAKTRAAAAARSDGALFAKEFPGESLSGDGDAVAWGETRRARRLAGYTREGADALWPVYRKALQAEVARRIRALLEGSIVHRVQGLGRVRFQVKVTKRGERPQAVLTCPARAMEAAIDRNIPNRIFYPHKAITRFVSRAVGRSVSYRTVLDDGAEGAKHFETWLFGDAP